MKIGKKTLILVLTVSAALILSVFAFAAGTAYDSTTDPLIAQSYLDARLEEQKTEYQAIIDALTARIDALEANSSDTSSEQTVQSAEFKSVALNSGDVIYPSGTQIEVILRSGRAAAVVPEGADGLPNITNGSTLADGKTLVSNHLILIPANDGRGIKVVSSTGAEILIRGEYTVEHAE